MTIARIQFLRSVKSSVVAKSIVHVEVILCSEFNDPISSLTSSKETPSFSASLYLPSSTLSSSQPSPLLNAELYSVFDVEIIKTTWIETSSSFALRLVLPDVDGRGCLKIDLKDAKESDVVVLPVISGWITLHRNQQDLALPVLSCYRIFQLSSSALVIKEEYGATLGSHLYDSSIVLLHYLETLYGGQKLEPGHAQQHILEVGAGCGLIGIYFASLGHRVLVTDKKNQLSLLVENIAENGVQSTCSAVEFNWESTEQLTEAKKKMEDRIDLIIACDVLYDKETAALFFEISKNLATSTSTSTCTSICPGTSSSLKGTSSKVKVLLAQKMRRNNDIESKTQTSTLVDVKVQSGFTTVEHLLQESDVSLWMLSM